jgi:hypothetical protein
VVSQGEDCEEAWRQKGSKHKRGGTSCWETRYSDLGSTYESIDSEDALPDGTCDLGFGCHFSDCSKICCQCERKNSTPSDTL